MKLHPIRWSAKTTILWAVALLLGVLLHEMFSFCPTIVTEFFSAVNESIWEHVKVVFWPLLLLVPLSVKREQQIEAHAASLVSSLVMLLLAWIYHIVLQQSLFVGDLVIFLLVMTLGFLFPQMVELPERAKGLVSALLIIWIGLIFCFTILPPHGALFRDAALVDAWVRLIC